MPTVHFKLYDVLRHYKKSPAALVEASGLAKTTVYNIVNNKAKAVELETLGKLVVGLRELTGASISIGDLLEEKTPPDWRDEILKNAKPIGEEALRALIPAWTPEERRENEAFLEILEEQRRIDRDLSFERDKKLLELFQPEEAE